jgi:glycerol uptake facilitator-like aquaporin
MITELPGLLIEAMGTAFPIVFGLIHLAISQFFKSKRNSYSRRYIIIYWSIAALLLLLLASCGRG